MPPLKAPAGIPVPAAAPGSYKYADTKNRLHRVHVEGNQTWKVEQCNLDDAAYFSLLDTPVPGKTRCGHCFRPKEEEQSDEQQQQEAGREPTPAISKRQVPKSLVLLPRRLFALLVALLAGIMFFSGNASGVVLSPDDGRGTVAGPSPSVAVPSPVACNATDLTGCGDLVILIEKLIDEQLLRHLTIDHPPEVSPSPSPSPVPTATPSATEDGTPERRRTTPIASPRPTQRPRPTARPSPMPTARPVPTASPSPTVTLCFHPGHGWTPDCKFPPFTKRPRP